jgi:hypothetical protein
MAPSRSVASKGGESQSSRRRRDDVVVRVHEYGGASWRAGDLGGHDRRDLAFERDITDLLDAGLTQ